MAVARVVIADDHPVVCEGIAAMLSAVPGIEVVGTAASGEELVERVTSLRPEIALVDIQMPGMGGIAAIKALSQASPLTRVIVLSVCAGDEDIRRASEAGAWAYLLKNAGRDKIVQMLRAVHAGHRHSPEAMAGLGAEPPAALTDRELEVLQMIARGLRNKEIGGALEISEGTVKTHVVNILSKLQVTDRTEAVTSALQRGIIHLD